MPSLGLQTSGLQMLAIYLCLFFIYGGLTLMIDDARDLSVRLGKIFDRLKFFAYKSNKNIHKIHLISSLITMYVAFSVFVYSLENLLIKEFWMISDLYAPIVATSFLFTGLWGLKAIKAKYWFVKLSLDISRQRSLPQRNINL
ncbi:MAG: hypothetical protein QW279_15375 [Candidatus Jordarchaeaceae archaeon]